MNRLCDYIKFTLHLLSFIIVVDALHNCYIYAEEPYQLGEISVTPGRFSISEEPSTTYLIQKSDMERIPLIDNDLLRTVHTLPGVTASDFSARFSLRGGDRDETLVIFDGLELHDPYHLQDFGGAISSIDMGTVAQADFYTGGFPAEYGDAMSGVLKVTTGMPRGTNGSLGIDLLNTHLVAQKRGLLLVSARRGYIDLLMDLIESEEVFRPSYYDLYSKLTHKVSSKDVISFHMLYAGDSNLIDRYDVSSDVRSRYWNGLIWSRWSHIFPNEVTLNSFLFIGRAGGRRREGVDGLDYRSSSFAGIKADLEFGITPTHMFKSGLKAQAYRSKYDYSSQGGGKITSVDTILEDWVFNGYVQDELKLTERIMTNFGVRCLYQRSGGYFSVMPRLAISLKPFKDTVVRSAWGIYHQPVQMNGLPVERGITRSLPPEKAHHYILSLEQSLGSKYLLRLEGYYKPYRDLFGQIKDYGRKEQVFVPAKSGSAKGIELYLDYSWRTKLSFTLVYALSRSTLETPIGTVPSDFDRRHAISMNVNYAIWSNGWLNMTWRYHSGDPYTESWYEKVPSNEGSSYEWQKHYGPFNAKRYPPYHSLDIRVTKSFQFNRFSFDLYLQIINLYNRRNVHEYTFEELTDKLGNTYYQQTEEHLLPLLPTIGLSARF